MALVIKAAEDFHHPDPRMQDASAAERIVITFWFKNDFGARLPSNMTQKAITYARVDYGRWVVDCPWCKSAQHASREDRRFFCVECGNAPVNGHWIGVFWPPEWEQIEELLSRRPHPGNQWWWPGETVQGLERENNENGVI